MRGQYPPDHQIPDPHEHHYLVHGPYRISGHHYYGVCKCGTPFRGNTRADIYATAQTHVDQHQPDGAA